MKYYKILIAVALFTTVIAACNKPQSTTLSINPEAGTRYKAGDEISIKVALPADLKADSIVYLVDSVRVASRKDTIAAKLKTDSMKLGSKLITARVFSAGKPQEISTNIMLLAAKPPEVYTFKVEKVFPHDTSSFTEGLVYQDGALYESAGGYQDPPQGQPKDQQSSLRKVNLETGKVMQKVMVSPKVFAEGISIVGDKILQLTYHEKIGYIYDKTTLKQLSTFANTIPIEGWGMCYDGKQLYLDDSTNRLWILSTDTYKPTGYVDVCDDKGPINEINELEYIDGKIYANIWRTDNIIVIDPKTGAVLETIDLSTLYPEAKRNPGHDVMNGIAWDAKGQRMFLTGKKWDKLFQVKFMKK